MFCPIRKHGSSRWSEITICRQPCFAFQYGNNVVRLLKEHRGQRKGEAERARGKRVDAGVIANTEPLDSVESSEEEEMKDDGIICKIC